MDVSTFATVMACTPLRAGRWLQPVTDAMTKHGVDEPWRQAAFLAQIGHESGGLQWTHELWGPTVAQAHYEGRADLGNTELGDGFRFRGRGLIQITGRANYVAASTALGYDFLSDPDAMAEPQWAAESAAWWWQQHGLNELADAGNFVGITRRINGGLNGYTDRLARWERAKQALGVTK